MNTRMNAINGAGRRLSGTVAGLLLAWALLAVSAAPGLAASLEIRLPDGSTWRGELGQQVEVTYVEGGVEQMIVGTLLKAERLFVQVEGMVAGIEATKTIFNGDLRRMTTIDDAPSGTPGEPLRAPKAGGSAATGDVMGDDGLLKAPKKGVFVLPLSGTVGIGLRHQEIEAIAEEADKYGPGQIIVLVIDSPGGLVIEGDRINESFKKLKDKHRFVAWIKEAISGAAFTALHCDEIYFMNVGTLGAITMFAGQTAISGNELTAWLDKCTKVAELGGRSGIPVRAMIHAPLLASYDKDEETGKVTWYESMEGEYVISDEADNLVFNATNAEHSGFSDGTADTVEQLAELLQLEEWYEINDYGRKIAKDWQDSVARAKEEIPKIFARLNFKGSGSGDPEEILGTRINLMKQLIRWWDRCPNVCRYEIGLPEKRQLERQIADMQKQLADMRRARRNAR